MEIDAGEEFKRVRIDAINGAASRGELAVVVFVDPWVDPGQMQKSVPRNVNYITVHVSAEDDFQITHRRLVRIRAEASFHLCHRPLTGADKSPQC